MKKENKLNLIFGSSKKQSVSKTRKKCCVCDGECWIMGKGWDEDALNGESTSHPVGRKKYLCSECAQTISNATIKMREAINKRKKAQTRAV